MRHGVLVSILFVSLISFSCDQTSGSPESVSVAPVSADKSAASNEEAANNSAGQAEPTATGDSAKAGEESAFSMPRPNADAGPETQLAWLLLESERVQGWATFYHMLAHYYRAQGVTHLMPMAAFAAPQSAEPYHIACQSAIRESPVQPDWGALAKIMDRAEEANHPATDAFIGECLRWGRGGRGHSDSAANIIQADAAKTGDPYARTMYGFALLTGGGIEADPEGALEYLRAGFEGGCAVAEYGLAYASVVGIGMEKDCAKGVEHIESLRAKGIHGAARLLAWMYNTGTHFDKDPVKARTLYEEAAAYDDSQSIYALGAMAFNGENGVKKDHDKAFELWSRAARMQNADGIYWLGQCYEKGYGTEKNRNKAMAAYQSFHAIKVDFQAALDWSSALAGSPRVPAREVIRAIPAMRIEIVDRGNTLKLVQRSVIEDAMAAQIRAAGKKVDPNARAVFKIELFGTLEQHAPAVNIRWMTLSVRDAGVVWSGKTLVPTVTTLGLGFAAAGEPRIIDPPFFNPRIRDEIKAAAAYAFQPTKHVVMNKAPQLFKDPNVAMEMYVRYLASMEFDTPNDLNVLTSPIQCEVSLDGTSRSISESWLKNTWTKSLEESGLEVKDSADLGIWHKVEVENEYMDRMRTRVNWLWQRSYAYCRDVIFMVDDKPVRTMGMFDVKHTYTITANEDQVVDQVETLIDAYVRLVR